MTNNPLMMLLEPLEKLIIEHGSAVIQEKHIALLKERFAFSEKRIADLASEKAVLQSKLQLLEAEVHQLQEQNKQYKLIVQKYEQPHGILLDKEKTDILLLLHKNKGELFTFQIAKTLNISEDIAKYHLEELRKNKLIERSDLPYRGLPGQQSWALNDKGTKYLIENKLIS